MAEQRREDWYQSYSPDGKHRVRIRVTYADGGEQDDRFPVVIMFNGFLLQDEHYAGIVQHVASWGYVVIQYTNVGNVPGLPWLKIVPDQEELKFLAPIINEVKAKMCDRVRRADWDMLATMGHSRGGKLAATLFARGSNVDACVLIDPVEVTPPQVPNLEDVALQLLAFMRELRGRIPPLGSLVFKSEDRERLEAIFSQMAPAFTTTDGTDEDEDDGTGPLGLLTRIGTRNATGRQVDVIRSTAAAVLGSLGDADRRGLFKAGRDDEEAQEMTKASLLSALNRVRKRELSPSAFAALELAYSWRRTKRLGVVGAGVCGGCNPEEGNYECFFDLASGGSWQLQVQKAGHMEFLSVGGPMQRNKASDLFVFLVNMICRGCDNGDSVVADTKTLAVSWLQAEMRPKQFATDFRAFEQWRAARNAAGAVNFRLRDDRPPAFIARTRLEKKRQRPSSESKSFDLNEYMMSRATLVDEALDRAVPQQYPDTLTESMRYSLLAGGKRLRPVLCLAACELVGGDTAAALPSACALEMVHTMSLIHDDLPALDNDDFRRGRPTNHKVYGEDIALLSGDALLSRSFEHVAAATKGVSAERVLRVIMELGRAVGAEGLMAGQVVKVQSEGKEVSLDVLQGMHLRRTAALLEASVVCGAVVGGADEPAVEKLRKYARNIGLAFQILDDVLEVSETAAQPGKAAAKDPAVSETTYPKLLGLEESRQRVDHLVREAIQQLDGFDPTLAMPLVGLAKYIGLRQR